MDRWVFFMIVMIVIWLWVVHLTIVQLDERIEEIESNITQQK